MEGTARWLIILLYGRSGNVTGIWKFSASSHDRLTEFGFILLLKQQENQTKYRKQVSIQGTSDERKQVIPETANRPRVPQQPPDARGGEARRTEPGGSLNSAGGGQSSRCYCYLRGRLRRERSNEEPRYVPMVSSVQIRGHRGKKHQERMARTTLELVLGRQRLPLLPTQREA